MKVMFHGIGGYGENEAIGGACLPHHDVIVVLAGTVHFTVGDLRLRCAPGHALHIAPHLLFLFLRGLGAVQPQIPGEGIDANAIKLLALREGLKNEPHPLPTVEALAERLGWSRAYFSARFQECCGEGPGTYLRSLRMEQAGRLLRETRLPIKIISQRLGYADPVAFHHAFRQAHGITPSKWRNGAPRVI